MAVLPWDTWCAVPGTDLAALVALPPAANIPDLEGPLQTTPVALGRSLAIGFRTLALDRCGRLAATMVALSLVTSALVLGGKPLAVVASLPTAEGMQNPGGEAVAAVALPPQRICSRT